MPRTFERQARARAGFVESADENLPLKRCAEALGIRFIFCGQPEKLEQSSPIAAFEEADLENYRNCLQLMLA